MVYRKIGIHNTNAKNSDTNMIFFLVNSILPTVQEPIENAFLALGVFPVIQCPNSMIIVHFLWYSIKFLKFVIEIYCQSLIYIVSFKLTWIIFTLDGYVVLLITKP